LRRLDCFVTSFLAMTIGKTAIVTGAGKRVGAALARGLIEDGWRVVAHVHHAEDPVPEGAVKVVADLGDPDCAGAIFAAAAGLPPVRLLVNNAARFAWDSLDQFRAGELAAHMAVNVQAPVLLTGRYASEHVAGQDGLVVNLLDSKLAAPNPDYLSYTLSKSALAAFTDLAARALAPKGIRVNGIAPGLMLQSSGQSETNFEAMHRNNPLHRGVEPEDVLDGIRYLARACCVTGQVLIIDSGHRFLGLDRDVQFLGEA
jgi:NAD(P)-dependent dehydrogenase (short-subunit alcohol dehydrogenase family)